MPHQVDRNTDVMREVAGTIVLVTDPAADLLLQKSAKNSPHQKKFTEFCGGKGGWSDYTERWH